jgi:hypothetical protein
MAWSRLSRVLITWRGLVHRTECFYKSTERKFKVAAELIGLWGVSINKYTFMTTDGEMIIVPFLVAILGSEISIWSCRQMGRCLCGGSCCRTSEPNRTMASSTHVLNTGAFWCKRPNGWGMNAAIRHTNNEEERGDNLKKNVSRSKKI